MMKANYKQQSEEIVRLRREVHKLEASSAENFLSFKGEIDKIHTKITESDEKVMSKVNKRIEQHY